MDEKDKELQELRRKINDLTQENERLKEYIIEMRFGEKKDEI